MCPNPYTVKYKFVFMFTGFEKPQLGWQGYCPGYSSKLSAWDYDQIYQQTSKGDMKKLRQASRLPRKINVKKSEAVQKTREKEAVFLLDIVIWISKSEQHDGSSWNEVTPDVVEECQKKGSERSEI